MPSSSQGAARRWGRQVGDSISISRQAGESGRQIRIGATALPVPPSAKNCHAAYASLSTALPSHATHLPVAALVVAQRRSAAPPPAPPLVVLGVDQALCSADGADTQCEVLRPAMHACGQQAFVGSLRIHQALQQQRCEMDASGKGRVVARLLMGIAGCSKHAQQHQRHVTLLRLLRRMRTDAQRTRRESEGSSALCHSPSSCTRCEHPPPRWRPAAHGRMHSCVATVPDATAAACKHPRASTRLARVGFPPACCQMRSPQCTNQHQSRPKHSTPTFQNSSSTNMALAAFSRACRFGGQRVETQTQVQNTKKWA